MIAQQSHHFGETEPQNTAKCFKIGLPSQTTSLGLLGGDEPVLWQFDEEIGLPVVSHMEHFGAMLGKYGQPDMRENGRTTTLPIEFTDEKENRFPQVNFTRGDTLGFFAPESKVANDFPRLYVGTFDDYQRLAQGCTQIIWGEPYERPAFAPSQQKCVREVCIAQPGEEPFRTTRPATEGWVRSKKLLDHLPTPAPSVPSRRTGDDD
jgi:hypothetical protein